MDTGLNALNYLLDAGFTHRQSIAILNAIADMTTDHNSSLSALDDLGMEENQNAN